MSYLVCPAFLCIEHFFPESVVEDLKLVASSELLLDLRLHVLDVFIETRVRDHFLLLPVVAKLQVQLRVPLNCERNRFSSPTHRLGRRRHVDVHSLSLSLSLVTVLVLVLSLFSCCFVSVVCSVCFLLSFSFVVVVVVVFLVFVVDTTR